MKKKFDMGTARKVDEFVATGSADDEIVDRVNFELPRHLRIRFNEEAARRDMKKRDLAREIFEFYFNR